VGGRGVALSRARPTRYLERAASPHIPPRYAEARPGRTVVGIVVGQVVGIVVGTSEGAFVGTAVGGCRERIASGQSRQPATGPQQYWLP
jgi:uncharacterized protein YcfJ